MTRAYFALLGALALSVVWLGFLNAVDLQFLTRFVLACACSAAGIAAVIAAHSLQTLIIWDNARRSRLKLSRHMAASEIISIDVRNQKRGWITSAGLNELTLQLRDGQRVTVELPTLLNRRMLADAAADLASRWNVPLQLHSIASLPNAPLRARTTLTRNEVLLYAQTKADEIMGVTSGMVLGVGFVILSIIFVPRDPDIPWTPMLSIACLSFWSIALALWMRLLAWTWQSHRPLIRISNNPSPQGSSSLTLPTTDVTALDIQPIIWGRPNYRWLRAWRIRLHTNDGLPPLPIVVRLANRRERRRLTTLALTLAQLWNVPVQGRVLLRAERHGPLPYRRLRFRK